MDAKAGAARTISFDNPDRVTIKPHQLAVNGASFRIALQVG
ncbi:MAG: hypothetical protein ABSG03_05475 [Bryobacteraceae bacterium]|jgi:hypothetical protein